MEVEQEFRTIKELVRNEMKEDERCRNDDKWLTWRVMRHFTSIYIPFEDFSKMPSFETIRRARQIIQNKDGVLLPTEKRAIQRRNREQNIRGLIGEI